MERRVTGTPATWIWQFIQMINTLVILRRVGTCKL
jgi:hypothetical protein